MKNKGFLGMIMSILGIVIFCSMFDTILTALGTLRSTSGASDFTVFTTIVGIAPVIIFLSVIVGGSYVYAKSYASISAGGADSAGMMRMVLGVMEVIVFITVFGTIITGVHAVWANSGSNGTVDNTTIWIALRTVTAIAPTVLFVGGLFAGGATAVGGYRARRRSRRLA